MLRTRSSSTPDLRARPGHWAPRSSTAVWRYPRQVPARFVAVHVLDAAQRDLVGKAGVTFDDATGSAKEVVGISGGKRGAGLRILVDDGNDGSGVSAGSGSPIGGASVVSRISEPISDPLSPSGDPPVPIVARGDPGEPRGGGVTGPRGCSANRCRRAGRCRCRACWDLPPCLPSPISVSDSAS